MKICIFRCFHDLYHIFVRMKTCNKYHAISNSTGKQISQSMRLFCFYVGHDLSFITCLLIFMFLFVCRFPNELFLFLQWRWLQWLAFLIHSFLLGFECSFPSTPCISFICSHVVIVLVIIITIVVFLWPYHFC